MLSLSGARRVKASGNDLFSPTTAARDWDCASIMLNVAIDDVSNELLGVETNRKRKAQKKHSKELPGPELFSIALHVHNNKYYNDEWMKNIYTRMSLESKKRLTK